MRLGHPEVWKPPNVGVGKGKQCPRGCDSVRLARNVASFRIRTAGRNPGPDTLKLGQQTPFKDKDDEKAAHTLPDWMMSVNADTKPRWRLSLSRWVPFLVILCESLRAKTVPFGPAEAQCALRGERGPLR